MSRLLPHQTPDRSLPRRLDDELSQGAREVECEPYGLGEAADHQLAAAGVDAGRHRFDRQKAGTADVVTRLRSSTMAAAPALMASASPCVSSPHEAAASLYVSRQIRLPL